MLKKTGPGALAYAVVHNPPTANGLVWIPRVVCDWTNGITWIPNPADGVLLDRAVYGIKDEKGLWAVTFFEKSRDGTGARLGLNSHAMVLVRSTPKESIQPGSWYLIECGRQVFVSGFFDRETLRVKGKKETTSVEEFEFRTGVLNEKPTRLLATDITHLAEILMVTRKPPPLPLPPKRRRSR